MVRNGGGSGDHQPKLLVAKGSFYTMGGAERDLIRNLPALSEEFEVVVATLSSSPDLESVCEAVSYTHLTLPTILRV